MSDLRAKLIDQNLTWLNNQAIYSGDINTDRIHFDFCSNWEGYIKTAIFYRSTDEIYQQLLDEDNSCIIPHEVLSQEGFICIGVYGVKDDRVLTSQCLRYRVQHGAISDRLSIEPPTLTIYEQVISQYGGMIIEQALFVEYQTALMQQYDEAISTSIQEVTNAKDLCLSAISALEVEFHDMNGGIPETTEEAYAHDVNGGYPVL